MRPSTLGALLFVVSLALAAAGCSDTINVTPPSEPSAPVPGTPEQVTEKFTGSLVAGGELYHAMNVNAGPVVTTVVGIGPDASVPIGVSVGILNSLACAAFIENPTATVGSQLQGLATGVTTICIRVYDTGTVPVNSTVSYELTFKYTK